MHFELDLSQLKRVSPFPCPLQKIFFSRGLNLPIETISTRKDHFEVCLRLSSGSASCCDVINGEPIRMPYPHAVWKMPMQTCAPRDKNPRDVLAFIYPSESLEIFRQLGLIPDASALPFRLNTEIGFLVEKAIRLIGSLYSPGVADQLDWIAVSLIKEILLSDEHRSARQTMEQKIRNIALHLKTRCSESHDFHALARQYNLNYTRFYREWNRCIGMTPHQYVMQARLDAAAELLRLTRTPIFKIIEAVRFSGNYAFYRKFGEKFGMTPLEYRKRFQKESPKPHGEEKLRP